MNRVIAPVCSRPRPSTLSRRTGDTHPVFYVEVADLYATLAHATAAGAATVRPLVDNGVILFAHLADPAGNRFGVWQRKVAA